MPGARLPMRKLRELLRLNPAGLAGRQIGAILGVIGRDGRCLCSPPPRARLRYTSEAEA